MIEPKWRLIIQGRLRANEFWGQTEPVWPMSKCTSVLLETSAGRVMLDPTIDAEGMTAALKEYANLRPEQVDLVLSTHQHWDHRGSAAAFSRATKMISAPELADEPAIAGLYVPLAGLPREIEAIATPGHTRGHTSFAWRYGERLVVFAGDAAMTREHISHRKPFNPNDPVSTLASMDKVLAMADILIPGHDMVMYPRMA